MACVALLAVGIAAVTTFAACSGGSSGGAAADDSGPTGVIGNGPSLDASLDSPPPDPLAPPGWVSYPAHDPDCHLYLPATTAALPAALAWDSCMTVLPPSIVCEQATWDGDDAYALSGWPHGKTVTLAVLPWGFSPGYTGIVDVDGPVHSATYFASSECYTTMMKVNDGKFVQTIVNTRNGTNYHGGGFIAGSIDSLVPEQDVSFGMSDRADHNAIVSKTFGVLDSYYDKFTPDGPWYRIYPWGGGAPSAPAPPLGSPAFAGTALLWSDGVSETIVRSPGGASAPFLPIMADAGDSIVAFTSDDTQMLWVDRQEVPDGGLGDPYADASLMIAPLTDDRTKLAPRRVAGESGEVGDYVTGCGYAARTYWDPNASTGGLRVERLSDGRWWQIPSIPSWFWDSPVGVSCSHVIVNAGRPGSKGAGGTRVLARIRLDSLGPGTPAN